MASNAFVTGSTYSTRSICDHDTIITVKVLSRTAKTIKAMVGGREAKTLRVSEYRGVEQVMPWGRYSMAPIVSAERPS